MAFPVFHKLNYPFGRGLGNGGSILAAALTAVQEESVSSSAGGPASPLETTAAKDAQHARDGPV